ncbi:MAG: Coenzyme F420 hydrogenase/dehydrogenase, beta subunit C-terminal domain [Oscillospiraceae bacterium]|nr:Coenzyme F420 hydrogenase/dehydrogenase, beta subunit C-terminal domain [Oscillospiraceae bacterium]
MINTVGKRCCGCAACSNTCPQTCISMVANEEGFNYPSINYDCCIQCGMCDVVCPALNRKSVEDVFYKNPIKTYAAVSLDRESLENSSSGGVFSVLAEDVLSKGGYVFGAAFSEDFYTVNHIGIDKVEKLGELQGSKYLQSEIGYTYQMCKQLLDKGTEVLFSGVPCQIAGLKRFLGKDYESLTCVEVICHGTPSASVWQKYLESIEVRQGKTKSVSFRDKTVNWDSFGMRIESDRNEVLSEIHQANTYMGIFLRNFALRESCYECPAKGDNTYADITLGDFWGLQNVCPEHYDEKGVSVVAVHTEKGQKAIDRISGKLVLHETDPVKSLEDNWIIYRPVSRPEKRDSFYTDLRKKTWREIENKYLDDRTMTQKFIDYLRRIKRVIFN